MTHSTMYIVPTNCPYSIHIGSNWGDLGVVKQVIIEKLILDYRSKIETEIQPGVWLTWTCAGCTKSECPQRECHLGGKI